MGDDRFEMDELMMMSFSRIGKNCSNLDATKNIGRVADLDAKKQKRSKSAFSYQSLAETPAILAGFDIDHGRRHLVCSSPRVHADAASAHGKSDEETVRFQRVIRWEDVPSANKKDGGHGVPGPDHETERRGSTVPGQTYLKKTIRERHQYPTYSFAVAERGKDSLEVRMKEVGRLAPPPGHYDATLTLVKPRDSKLGYIKHIDRPNAPTVIADKLMRSRSPEKGRNKSAMGDTWSASEEFPQELTPRTALKIIQTKDFSTLSLDDSMMKSQLERDRELQASRADTVPQPVGSENSGDKDEVAEVAEAEEKEPPRPATSMARLAGTNKTEWLSPDNTASFDKTLPRNKNGRSTVTGHFSDNGKSTPDVWYQPMYEDVPAICNHIPAPDLSRSGKDYDDQLKRLGFKAPEEAAASPVYLSVTSPLRWTSEKGWLQATKKQSNKTLVNLARAQPRNITVDNGEARSEYRSSHARGIDSVCPDEAHPIYPHVPTLNMARSSSQHGEVANVSVCNPAVPYRVSHRLVMSRSPSVIPFQKCIERRPLTADQFTGKPVKQIMDKMFDLDQPLASVKARPITLADFARRPGREGWGNQEIEPASGGLHGTSYWSNVQTHNDMFGNMRKQKLPNLMKTPGREAHTNGDTSKETLKLVEMLDGYHREPMSKAGKEAWLVGHTTGQLWNPKDNVTLRHVETPNLDTNVRARDAEKLKKHPPPSKDLNYDVKDHLTKKRPRAAVISKSNLKS